MGIHQRRMANKPTLTPPPDVVADDQSRPLRPNKRAADPLARLREQRMAEEIDATHSARWPKAPVLAFVIVTCGAFWVFAFTVVAHLFRR